MPRETKEQKIQRLQLEQAAENFRLHMEWQEFSGRYHEGLLALMVAYKTARILPKESMQVEVTQSLAPHKGYNLRFSEAGEDFGTIACLPIVLPDDRDEDLMLDYTAVGRALDLFRERCRIYDETQAKIVAAKAKLSPEELKLLGIK